MTARYLIFGGECYYAAGGLSDLIGWADDEEKAVTLAKDFREKGYNVPYTHDSSELLHEEIQWVQVLDTATLKMIYSDGEAYKSYDFHSNYSTDVFINRIPKVAKND